MADININSATSVGRGIVSGDYMLGWDSSGVVKADTLSEIVSTIKPSRVYTGGDDPTTTPPAGAIEGDIYLRGNGSVYKRNSTAFVDTGINLEGAKGTDGATGGRWFTGLHSPTPLNTPTAVNGDYFLLNNGKVFKRGATAFTDTGINLLGAVGAQGYQGKYLIRIYRSATSAPATPTGGSYTIGGTFTAPTDWSTALPTPKAGERIYEAQSEIDPATQSGAITPTWQKPFDLGGTGAEGYAGGWQYTAYINAATKPSKPNSGSYNKMTGVITLPAGWGTSPTTPPSGEEVWAIVSFILPHSRTAGSVSLNWSEPAQITASSMAKGDPGVGVPTGGSTGEVLAKKSGADYDTEWVDDSSLTAVVSDTSLTGSGTTTDPLKVATPLTAAEKKEIDAAVDKVENIEPQATADQTGVEMKAALEALTGTGRLEASAVQDVITGVVSDATLTGAGTTASPLVVANPFTAADESKLDAIEAGATADQTAAEMKTALETLQNNARLDATAIKNIPAPGISKALSDHTLLGDGTFGNNLSVAHPYSAAEKTKLAGIETAATADQTGAEMKTELEKLTGTNRLDGSAIQNISGLSTAEKTKLAGIETAATADQSATEIKTALETLTGNDRLDVTAIKNLRLSSQTATQLKQSLETLTGDNRLAATAINLNTDDSLEGTGSKALPLKLSFEATSPEEAERARDATNYITPFDLSRFVYNKTDHIALKEEHHDISGVTHDGTHITFISDRKDVFDIDLDTAKHPSDYRGIAYLGLLNDDDANYKIERSNSFYFVADADTHSIGITRITLNGNKHDTTGAAALRTAVGLGATGVMQTRALAAEWGLDDTLAVIFSDDNVMKFAVTTYDSTNIRAHGNYTTRWNFPADLTAPLDADWNQYRETVHVLDGYKIRAFKVADGTEDATRSYNLPQTLPAPTGFTIKAPYIWVSTAQTIYAVDLATLSYVENGSIPVANTIRHGTVTRSQGLGFVGEADAYTPSMERNIHLSMQLNANPPMAGYFYGISGSFTTSLQLMNVADLGSSVNDGFGGITDRAYCMTIKEGTLEAYVVCWDGTNKRLYKLDLFTGEAFAFPNILNVGLAEPMAITFHYNKLVGITSDGRIFEANTDTGSGKFITSASEAALADDTATSLISLREAGTDTFTLLAQGEQYHYPRLVNTVDGTGANHHFTLTSNTPTGYKSVTQDYLIKLWDCNSRTTASNVYGQPAMNAFVYAKPTASTKVSDPFELYLVKLTQYNYSSSHLTFENLTHITLNKDTGISQEHIKSFSVGAGGEIFAIQTGEGGSTAGLMKVIRPF